MTLEEWANHLLFGTSLEEKLLGCPPVSTSPVVASGLIAPPLFPGRPPRLSKIGKGEFPSLHRLHLPEERGKVLHFFANHELLALELMALVLLRFPQAHPSFRAGVAKIISEEQGHLQLYITRMKELGVELGDIPVNDYFWKCMKEVRSPLDFTVQMSLTFEQANLDFSFYYMNAVQAVGDTLTAALLERVFREEMGHVKHGLVWFNRWRESAHSQTEWDAYRELLPFPLNPQRAKGQNFCEEARRQIGFSENYIRELRAFSGSKGRPPVLWIYNPHCDNEILRGRPGYTPSGPAQKMRGDLEVIPTFLSQGTDVVLIEKKPSIEWIESLQSAGIEIPEYLETAEAEKLARPKIAGIEPWGWSPEVIPLFTPLLPRLVRADGGNSDFAQSVITQDNLTAHGAGRIFSKTWSVEFLNDWLGRHPNFSSFFATQKETGRIYKEWNSAIGALSDLLKIYSRAMIKAPFGTSGMQVKAISRLEDLEGPLGGWIRKILKTQGQLVVEPYLNRVADLSIQMKIQDHEITLLEVRQFITGAHHEYRGTILGSKFYSLTQEQLRFFHSTLKPWKGFLRDLGKRLREEGYRGPAGVDAFLWQTPEGDLRLKPLVELNPRWTMGRVALEVEKHLAPGVTGAWIFIPLRELPKMGYSDPLAFVQSMRSQYPIRTETSGERKRIRSGVLFTNDPAQAKTVMTLLVTFPNPELERKIK